MSNSKIQLCGVCGGNHPLARCSVFQAYSLDHRVQYIEDSESCPRCLLPLRICGARNEDARDEGVCGNCYCGGHHTMLCGSRRAREVNKKVRRRDFGDGDCQICGWKHRTISCCELRGWSKEDRFQFRLDRRMCTKCLEVPHADNCLGTRCKICGSPRHHELFHEDRDEPGLGALARDESMRHGVRPPPRFGRDARVALPGLVPLQEGVMRSVAGHQVVNILPRDPRDDFRSLPHQGGGVGGSAGNGPVGVGGRNQPLVSGATWRGLEETVDKVRVAERPRIQIRSFARLEGPPKCELCSRPRHPLDECPDFLSAGVLRREKYVAHLGGCTVCLKTEHQATECVWGGECGYAGCQVRHHVLLHRLPYERGLSIAENTRAHSEAHKKHIEWRCGLCVSVGHSVEDCVAWPIYRCNRREVAWRQGLCEQCLAPEHSAIHCMARESVCGINGCPENHHPMLHPNPPERIQGPNRPNADRRTGHLLGSDSRYHEGIDLETMKEILGENFPGTDYFEHQGRGFSIRRSMGRGQEVIMSPEGFMLLFEAFVGRNEQDPPSRDEEEQDEDPEATLRVEPRSSGGNDNSQN